MTQGEKYEPTYIAIELKEFKAELEEKIKKQVFLKIEKYQHKGNYYQAHSHIYDTICCKKINTEIKYSRELYEKYHREKIEEIKEACRRGKKTGEEIEKEIEGKIREDIMCCIKKSNYHLIFDIVHFEAEKFDEESAYRCGLQPFIYINHDIKTNIEVISSSGGKRL